MVKVKICGITRPADVRAAVEAGADAVGFVTGFPSSPRNIPLSKVSELVGLVPPFVSTVIVTRYEELMHNLDAIKEMGINTIQLYGCKEPRTVRRHMRVNLIRPYVVGHETLDAAEAVCGFDCLLSDTYRNGMDGGTGIVSDWDVCRRIRKEIEPAPLILSGGLNPANVHEAIKLVRPYAVDASSGLETSPGRKDSRLVAKFVSNAKKADPAR